MNVPPTRTQKISPKIEEQDPNQKNSQEKGMNTRFPPNKPWMIGLNRDSYKVWR